MPLARVCKVLGACKLDQYLRMSPLYCSPHFPTSFNVAVFCYYALKTNIYTFQCHIQRSSRKDFQISANIKDSKAL